MNGALVTVIVAVVVLAGVIVGYYTRRGNDITPRPSDGRGAAPGAAGPDRITGAGGDDPSSLDTHGTA